MDKLNIRLITKNDELSNWETSTLPLHKGELVLAKINVMQPDGTSAPTFVAKVGMEGKTFSESPWFFARSADVYPWAKKRNLDIDDIPALSIDNIEGLQTVLDELAFNRVWTGEEEPTDNYDIWIDPNSADVTSIETIVNNSVNSALNDALDNGMFTGKSAYQSALDLGFEGSEEEWLESLVGKDYVLTEADKSEIAKEATALVDTSGFVAKYQGADNVGKILVVGTDGKLTLIDMPEGGDVVGVLDGANNIILTGALASGTYTLKYEYEDGTVSDVGIIEVGGYSRTRTRAD